MSKASPLPWKRGTDGLIYDAADELVVDCFGACLPPEGEENQKLIVDSVNRMSQVFQALASYHQAMKQRKDGHVAANNFAWRCEEILGQSYSQDTKEIDHEITP